MEGRPLKESELIDLAKRGDLSAYEDLVAIHQALALRVAYLVVRDHAEAEDVTQEAFIKAYRTLNRFRDGSPFKPWILRIVRNEGLNRRRGAGRYQNATLHLAAETSSGDAAPSPEEVLVVKERQETVLRALDELPERFRLVLEARYLLELNEQETAAVLRIARGTVKSRTARGLEQLRRLIGDRDV